MTVQASSIGHDSGGHGSKALSYSSHSAHNTVKVNKKPPIFNQPGAHIALSDYQKNVSIM